MSDLYKRDPATTMERLVGFWKRQAKDRILISTLTPNPYWDDYLRAHGYPTSYRVAYPGYTLSYFPEGVAPFTAQCLCLEDPSRVMAMIDAQQRLCADLDDDSMPIGYPNLHFGESLFSGFVGARIQFTGNGLYTWSGTQSPPVRTWDDLEGVLASPLREPWRSGFEKMAHHAVEHAQGRFGLRTFITEDTLNLALEWRGSTQVYLDVVDAPENLQRIFARGVQLNKEVLALERTCFDPYNRRVFQNDAFCVLAPAFERPLLSVDAFALASPRFYQERGMSYQQRLLDEFGGGHMHMHGTSLYRLLPFVAQLQGLISIELNDDGLGPDDPPPVENLKRIQGEITRDIPLFVHCTRGQFLEGLSKRTLAGGVHYCVRGVESVREANALVARAHEYVASN